MQNTTTKIGEWIRSARKKAGLSGEALGVKLAFELPNARGITKANISHWEQGRHEPGLAQLIAISRICATPLPDFLQSRLPTPVGDDSVGADASESLGRADQKFLEEVRSALVAREVPDHVRSAVITLLASSTLKKQQS